MVSSFAAKRKRLLSEQKRVLAGLRKNIPASKTRVVRLEYWGSYGCSVVEDYDDSNEAMRFVLQKNRAKTGGTINMFQYRAYNDKGKLLM